MPSGQQARRRTAAVSASEHPDRLREGHEVTIDDVRQLMGASTPHFALQLRDRIRHLIAPLAAQHPARVEGEREIVRLDRIAFSGETRGHAAEPGMATLPSVTDDVSRGIPGETAH